MKILIVILLMTFAASAATARADDSAGGYTLAWRQMIASAEQPTPVATIGKTEVAIHPATCCAIAKWSR